MATVRPRVLIVPEWYPSTDRPGRAPWAREHARAVASLVEVAVLVADPARGHPAWTLEERAEEGLRVVRVGHPDLPDYRLAYPGRVAALARGVRHLARSGWIPDILHARIFYSGFACLLLARPYDAPVIVSEHFTAFPRGEVRGVGRWMAKTTFERAALVCPDAADLGRHIRALGIGGRMRVMPNIVDGNVFAPRGRPRRADRSLTLLNVASLDPKKGQVDLLDATAIARQVGLDVRLRIIGEGGLREELGRRVVDLGLGEWVTFLGGRDKQEVAEEMRSADAMILPSHYENAPLAVSEALVSGLPVIATDVGDVAHMIGEGDGIVVPPRRPDLLAEAVRAVAERPPKPDVERARERWGHEAAGAQWAAIYEEEIARRRARRSRAA